MTDTFDPDADFGLDLETGEVYVSRGEQGRSRPIEPVPPVPPIPGQRPRPQHSAPPPSARQQPRGQSASGQHAQPQQARPQQPHPQQTRQSQAQGPQSQGSQTYGSQTYGSQAEYAQAYNERAQNARSTTGQSQSQRSQSQQSGYSQHRDHSGGANPHAMPMSDHAAVRVPEPLSVLWQGTEYSAVHWDVHGFELETSIPRIVAPGRGRVFDVTLLVGQGGTRIEMRVQAKIDNVDDPAPKKFSFVDLDRAQAEVLHRIVDAVVSEQAMSLTRLLNETEDTRSVRRETGSKVRTVRTGFQLILAGVVLAAAAVLTWSSFSTVRARFAAVTVGATSLSVPVAGRISMLNAHPGETVATGDILGYVRAANSEDRAETFSDQRRTLEMERAGLHSQRGTMTQLSEIVVEGNGSDRTRVEESVRLAERRLSVERALLASLQSTGLPTATRQRERARQEAVVLQAETRVLDLQTRLNGLARTEILAPMGVLQADLRSGTQTLSTVDVRIAALDSEIEALQQREDRARFGEPIVSPCDCTVQQIDHRIGEWSSPDDQLAVLVGTEAPTIHALILGENARSIELGDRAQIELADGTSLNGRVSRMNYDAHWRGFTGLQDNVFAADRYARIEVTPAMPMNAPVGMVAEVNVHTNDLLASLSEFVGL